MELLIIFGVMFAACCVAALIGILLEKWSWNKGICRRCDGTLKFFSHDSHGGRGYQCNKCLRYVWISYNCVDKNRRS